MRGNTGTTRFLLAVLGGWTMASAATTTTTMWMAGSGLLTFMWVSAVVPVADANANAQDDDATLSPERLFRRTVSEFQQSNPNPPGDKINLDCNNS